MWQYRSLRGDYFSFVSPFSVIQYTYLLLSLFFAPEQCDQMVSLFVQYLFDHLQQWKITQYHKKLTK